MKLFIRGLVDRLFWIGALFIVIPAASIIVVSTSIRKLTQAAVKLLMGMLRTVPKGTNQR